ncbi:META domain-containing protein [Photobacterium leiognathi]|uniref:META domain-containing protein n=1 Tax=Photobacterium leiognathi TaxID=553611 RepID=UPI002981349E|nr:META domain-containing protein [Photobacterium leiognathi]
MTFKLKKLALATSVVLSAFMLQACNDADTAANQNQQQTAPVAKAEKVEMKSLETKVIYLDRRMLPPGAVLNVTLEDVSLADAPSTTITSESMDVAGAPPYPVTLDYDAARIQDKHRYSLRATIKVGDELVMTSTTSIDPFAADAKQPIEIKLDRVAQQAPEVTAATGLAGQPWELVTLAGETVKPGADGNMAFIQFDMDKKSAYGFSGCNNFQGTFETSNGTLTMGPAASTRKMCMDGMELEKAFLASVPTYASYAIVDNVLTVKDKQGKEVATFKAGN